MQFHHPTKDSKNTDPSGTTRRTADTRATDPPARLQLQVHPKAQVQLVRLHLAATLNALSEAACIAVALLGQLALTKMLAPPAYVLRSGGKESGRRARALPACSSKGRDEEQQQCCVSVSWAVNVAMLSVLRESVRERKRAGESGMEGSSEQLQFAAHVKLRPSCVSSDARATNSHTHASQAAQRVRKNESLLHRGERGQAYEGGIRPSKQGRVHVRGG